MLTKKELLTIACALGDRIEHLENILRDSKPTDAGVHMIKSEIKEVQEVLDKVNKLI